MRRLLLAVLSLLALVPATAVAAPAVSGEFAVSETPDHLVQGPDGNIWVTLATKIAKVTPSGAVTEYSPGAITGPRGITAGADGNLWVTQAGGVVRVPPANPTLATAFPITGITDPRGITTGPDGNLWAASGANVVKISPASPIPASPAFPVLVGARGIARGNDGMLWVADFAGARLVSVTTTGAPTNYATGGGPQELVAGPGNQIGYTNPGATPENIGRVMPGGVPQPTLVDGDPFGIVLGNDGAYWIARFLTNQLLRFTPSGQTSPLTGFSAGAGPRQIATGPGNTLWVSLETAKKIARITGVAAGSTPPPSSTPDTTAPILSSVSASPKTWHLGKALPSFARRKPAVGTTIKFRVNEQSTTTLTFSRLLPGRKVGRRCLAATRSRRHRRRCTRAVTIRPSLSFTTTPALHRLGFQGRLTRRKKLSPGRYQVSITARDAARNLSGAKSLTFTVLPAVQRPRR